MTIDTQTPIRVTTPLPDDSLTKAELKDYERLVAQARVLRDGGQLDLAEWFASRALQILRFVRTS